MAGRIWQLLFVFLLLASAIHAKPDLIVSGAEMTKDASGKYVATITVTVTNACRQATAEASYVSITFRQGEQPGSKAIYFIGNTIKALKGGESQTRTFDVSDKKIGFGRFVIIEADPYKKVSEAVEDNNWRTLFPNAAGEVPNQDQCGRAT